LLKKKKEINQADTGMQKVEMNAFQEKSQKQWGGRIRGGE